MPSPVPVIHSHGAVIPKIGFGTSRIGDLTLPHGRVLFDYIKDKAP